MDGDRCRQWVPLQYRCRSRLNVSQYNSAFCDLQLNHLCHSPITCILNFAIQNEVPVIPQCPWWALASEREFAAVRGWAGIGLVLDS
ncbi:MAG TPA: hypothetical protein VFG29_05620 [Syntrophales bacterium]|nr:hypothetical protein [Syntrophales bacterium]